MPRTLCRLTVPALAPSGQEGPHHVFGVAVVDVRAAVGGAAPAALLGALADVARPRNLIAGSVIAAPVLQDLVGLRGVGRVGI